MLGYELSLALFICVRTEKANMAREDSFNLLPACLCVWLASLIVHCCNFAVCVL
jgi:hypothetical protein